MSRVGKKPIEIPSTVKVEIVDHQVKVVGPKGELSYQLPSCLTPTLRQNQLLLTNKTPKNREARALHGLFRSLLANAVHGVSQGFKKELVVKGVGYRATMQGNKLVLNLGYSHPIEFVPPEGIEIKTEKNTIVVSGYDKQKVGQIAAQIRDFRKPEPYKGKGIMYKDEKIIRKPGKAAKAQG